VTSVSTTQLSSLTSPPASAFRLLIDAVAEQEGAQRLARAIALTEGFAFCIVTCKSYRSAAALQHWLTESLALAEPARRTVVRVSPYPLDPLVAGPETLDFDTLAQLVTRGLGRATVAELEHDSEGNTIERLVFLDASRATSSTAGAWTALFKRLNERRNATSRDLRGVLVLLLPESLEGDFARAAPDFWSIRSHVVHLAEAAPASTPGRVLVQAHDVAFASNEDPKTLELEVARQRELARGNSPSSKRALRILLLRLAGANRRLGKLDQSLSLIAEAAALSKTLDDRPALAACWLARGDILAQQGQLDEALDLARRATGELESAGDEWTLAAAKGQVADILQARGDLDEALRIRREEQLPVYEKLGDVRERAVAMGKVADILRARGELDEALRIRREEQLPVYEKLGDVREHAVTMGKVADILQARGELDEALRIRREEQLPVYEKLGDVHSRAVTMGQVADILQARGELDEALRIRREEQLPVYEKLGDVRERAVTMGKVADILQARGQLDEALRIRREEQLPVYEKLGDVEAAQDPPSPAGPPVQRATLPLMGRARPPGGMPRAATWAFSMVVVCFGLFMATLFGWIGSDPEAPVTEMAAGVGADAAHGDPDPVDLDPVVPDPELGPAPSPEAKPKPVGVLVLVYGNHGGELKLGPRRVSTINNAAYLKLPPGSYQVSWRPTGSSTWTSHGKVRIPNVAPNRVQVRVTRQGRLELEELEK